jgi:hypothetical protein
VNHFQRNRECAINFEILRRLVQDDTLLMQRVTRESYPELLQVSAFYHSHFPTLRFVHDFPGVFQMMQRETVAAFAKLLPNTKVISKFDEEYPASFEGRGAFVPLCQRKHRASSAPLRENRHRRQPQRQRKGNDPRPCDLRAIGKSGLCRRERLRRSLGYLRPIGRAGSGIPYNRFLAYPASQILRGRKSKRVDQTQLVS